MTIMTTHPRDETYTTWYNQAALRQATRDTRQYKILTAVTISDLELTVEAYMKKGFTPVGAVTFTGGKNQKNDYWMQAVYNRG